MGSCVDLSDLAVVVSEVQQCKAFASTIAENEGCLVAGRAVVVSGSSPERDRGEHKERKTNKNTQEFKPKGALAYTRIKYVRMCTQCVRMRK